MIVKAITKNLRVSPRKLNLLAKLIRGMKVFKALDALAFSHKRVAVEVRKTLQSAISNAETNESLDIDNLEVCEAYVGQGSILRRWQARAKGRGAPIKKDFSHLTITVREGKI